MCQKKVFDVGQKAKFRTEKSFCFGLFKNPLSKKDDYFNIYKTKSKNAPSTWISTHCEFSLATCI